MLNARLSAIAAVMGLAVCSLSEADAQVYYGYRASVPAARPYHAPVANPYAVPGNTYHGQYVYPATNRSNCYPFNGVPSNTYGRPVYSYPPVYNTSVPRQPIGNYGAPVYYVPSGTQYQTPVNRPIYTAPGHFSVQDEFSNPADTSPFMLDSGSPTLPVNNSPFYSNPGVVFPTSDYIPVNRPSPVNSIPASSSPFYE